MAELKKVCAGRTWSTASSRVPFATQSSAGLTRQQESRFDRDQPSVDCRFRHSLASSSMNARYRAEACDSAGCSYHGRPLAASSRSPHVDRGTLGPVCTKRSRDVTAGSMKRYWSGRWQSRRPALLLALSMETARVLIPYPQNATLTARSTASFTSPSLIAHSHISKQARCSQQGLQLLLLLRRVLLVRRRPLNQPFPDARALRPSFLPCPELLFWRRSR